MCAGAAVHARVEEIVFGALDPKAGAVHSWFLIASDERMNHRAMVIFGVLGKECADLFTKFFPPRRKKA